MNTTQLETFMAVADTLSFARAAENLHVTQPAVTHQIKTLEAELGTQLFNRTTRRVRLTDDGYAFLADAEAILATERRARDRFRDKTRTEPLRLTVGCRSFSYTVFLSEAFKDLASKWDNLHPDLMVIPHDHLHQRLIEGNIDVVLDFAGTGNGDESFHEAAQVPVVCVCPSDSPIARLKTVLPQDLESETFAFTRPGRQSQELLEVTRDLLRERNLNEHYICGSVEAAITIVQAGLAVSIQPLLAVPPDQSFTCVPLAGVDPISFGVYTRGQQTTPVVDRFIEKIRSILASHPNRWSACLPTP